jgi:hypothetical protein
LDENLGILDVIGEYGSLNVIMISTHSLICRTSNCLLDYYAICGVQELKEIEQGELFKDNNTNHILQYVPGVGLVHNEILCKEITGCINFQQNN